MKRKGGSSVSFHFSELDPVLFTLYAILVFMGLGMIYSVNHLPDSPGYLFDLRTEPSKQMFFILISATLVFVVMFVEWTFWRDFAWLFYFAALALQLGVFVFGREINGALAWYQFGGFSLQPGEFSKLGAVLAMAAYLGAPNINLKSWRQRFTAAAIFLIPAAIIILQKDTGTALVFLSFLLLLYRVGLPGEWFVLGFAAIVLVVSALMWQNPLLIIGLLAALFNYWGIGRLEDNRRPFWIALGILVFGLLFGANLFEAIQPYLKLEKPIPIDFSSPEYAVTSAHTLLPMLVLTLIVFVKNFVIRNPIRRQQTVLFLALALFGSGLAYGANYVSQKVLAAHQRERINVWLQPPGVEIDPRGSAYNLIHSKIAIGAGGLLGKGYLEGNMTKLKYVPAQSTDFIFCTMGEEQGFLGVAATLTFLLLLLWRIVTIAERQRSLFSKYYAYGVLGILFVHVAVNVGMTMGVFPIIGIPLPFFSYGGSSLIAFSLMIAILLKLDSNRSLLG